MNWFYSFQSNYKTAHTFEFNCIQQCSFQSHTSIKAIQIQLHILQVKHRILISTQISVCLVLDWKPFSNRLFKKLYHTKYDEFEFEYVFNQTNRLVTGDVLITAFVCLIIVITLTSDNFILQIFIVIYQSKCTKPMEISMIWNWNDRLLLYLTNWCLIWRIAFFDGASMFPVANK